MAVIVSDPPLKADGEKVTVQLEVVVEPTWLSVHGLPPKVPAPVLEKFTVPWGQDFVPESVSETTTVQVVVWLIATDAGLHPVTWVEVVRLVTPRATPVVSDDPAWTPSVGV